MATHQSAKKRIRQNAKRREHNKYYKKSTRSAIKNILEMTDEKKARDFLPKVVSQIDKLVKRNIWHANKAANKKSQIMKHINNLS